jgi:hypothetical protein
VHTWYYGTVTAALPTDWAGFSGASRNNDGDVSFPDAWWGVSGVPARTAIGFAYSAIGGAARDGLPISGVKSMSGSIDPVFDGNLTFGSDGLLSDSLPGWEKHGGGGSAPLGGGSNLYFQLASGGTNSFRRHNPLYFDRYASAVKFDYWINDNDAAGPDDQLQVLVGDAVIDVVPLANITEGFVRDRKADLKLPAPMVGALEFRLVDANGDGIESAVRIDNVRLVERPPALSAEFDGNGLIDGADFLRWQRGLGTYLHGNRNLGDADDDGNVLADDLAVWQAAFEDRAPGAQNAMAKPQAQLDAALEAFASGGAYEAVSVWNPFPSPASRGGWFKKSL